MSRRSSKSEEIPGYKALWRDVYRISPVHAWVGLFAFVGGVAAIIHLCFMAVVTAFEYRGCVAAVKIGAILVLPTIGILFGMYKDLSEPIPWNEGEKESEERMNESNT